MQSAAGIFGSAILEVAIGIIFLYFILSVVCSSLTELVASLLQWRARDLEKALRHLLGESGIYQNVVDHPLITALGHNRASGWWDSLIGKLRGGTTVQGRPAYLPAATFRTALLDAVANHGLDSGADRVPATVSQLKARLRTLSGQDQQQVGKALATLIEDSRDPLAVAARVDALKEMILKLPSKSGDEESVRLLTLAMAPCARLEELQQALTDLQGVDAQLLSPARTIVANAIRDMESIAYDLDKLQRNVEAWFDNAMDRMSGVYKRHVQAFLLAVGLLVTLGTGADTLRFATTLWANPTVRSQLASAGQNQTQQAPALTEAVNDLAPFALLFGYADIPSADRLSRAPEQTTSVWLFWVEKVVGLAATTLAIMMGGPFWFQLLQKLVNVRSAGPKPKRSDAAAVETASV